MRLSRCTWCKQPGKTFRPAPPLLTRPPARLPWTHLQVLCVGPPPLLPNNGTNSTTEPLPTPGSRAGQAPPANGSCQGVQVTVAQTAYTLGQLAKQLQVASAELVRLNSNLTFPLQPGAVVCMPEAEDCKTHTVLPGERSGRGAGCGLRKGREYAGCGALATSLLASPMHVFMCVELPALQLQQGQLAAWLSNSALARHLAGLAPPRGALFCVRRGVPVAHCLQLLHQPGGTCLPQPLPAGPGKPLAVLLYRGRSGI